MRQYWLALLALVVLLGFVPAGAAEVPAGRWWHMPRVADKLRLGAEERERLDRIYMDNRHNLIDLKGRVEKEQFDLTEMLDGPHLDEQKIMEQFRRLDEARSALAEERFRFLLEVRKILGPDRFRALRFLYRELKTSGDRGPRRRVP